MLYDELLHALGECFFIGHLLLLMLWWIEDVTKESGETLSESLVCFVLGLDRGCCFFAAGASVVFACHFGRPITQRGRRSSILSDPRRPFFGSWASNWLFGHFAVGACSSAE